ncbi:MAG: glycoside hydrolase family 2 TIM barrel-domain containing protein [Kiritimatiellia bacterium]
MDSLESLKKKFPAKNAEARKKRAKVLRNIARDYERKRMEILRKGPPMMKKGVLFYGIVIFVLVMVGGLVIQGTLMPPKVQPTKAQINVRKSIDAVAEALGRYRYHVGTFPTTEEGLAQLASTTVAKAGWNGPYINHVVKDPWGHDYVYVYNGETENPTLYSMGPDGLRGTSDDVLPDPALFEKAFMDTGWTKGWMPQHLRGYVVAPDARTKRILEDQVRHIENPDVPLAGETVLRDGWEFAQVWKDTLPASTNAVARRARAADDPALVWKKVRVPHDWAIEGPFDAACPDGGTGRLPWVGVGYYRRKIVLPQKAKGAFIALRFAGVMARPEVFLNGEKVGGWDYGYMGFEVDISDKAKIGEPNELLVKVDTSAHRSRWYPGAGIIRDVTLAIEDREDRVLFGSLKISLMDVTTERAQMRAEYAMPKGAVTNDFIVPYPKLWRPEFPYLYTLPLCGKNYRYGIRTAEFTADDGFLLNGERLQLKGVNLHADLGPLGMAFNRTAMRRQLEIMKDMGVNAIRTSHNPPDPQLLDLCDEMGFVVWDECFDKWDGTAGIRADEELEEVVVRNLKAFVRRDRNHPCVVVWSIGNEIAPASETYPAGATAARCRRFRAAILEEDDSRPVGIGCCHTSAVDQGIYADLDLTGWNYGARYMPMRTKYPDKPVVYSESASAFSSWGYFRHPMTANPLAYDERTVVEIDSYDRCAASWSDIPDVEFARMAHDRFCAGEFVWTGIDYLGEPSPNAYLNRSSFFGICDLMAMPKDRYYLYRSLWNDRDKTIHLLPHWNWEGHEGEPITVMCYTNGDAAELFLNGESRGRRSKRAELPQVVGKGSPDYYKVTECYRLVWEVPYEPGELKVIAYKDGVVLGEDVRKTAYEAFAVRLTAERNYLVDDDIAFVKVEFVDDAGTVLPQAQDEVKFRLEGPGEILAVGNGSTSATASFAETSSHPLYNGRAAVVIRRNAGSGLPLRLTASAAGVRAGTLILPRQPSR